MEPRKSYASVWGWAGVALMPLLLLKASGLRLGDGLWAGISLCILFGLALLLTAREKVDMERLLPFLFPLAAAFFLRIFLLDYQTLDYQDFLAQWAAFFRENGGLAALDKPVGNYNVPYLYFMALISYLKIPDLYLIKLFSILFDVLLAWGGFRLVRRLAGDNRPRLPLFAFCGLLLLPTVLLNGAYWGQCDSIYAALCLHALASALDEKPAGSVLLLAAAFSFKLQAIFLVPLWCALWYSGRVKFRHLLLFPAGCAAIAAPALLAGKPLSDILAIYLGQMGINSSLSFNAPSVFSFLPYGAEVNMDLAAKLGILAAFLLVLALLGALFFRRKSITDRQLLLAGTVLALGVPFFLPYMHDRYFFPADVLTLLLALLWPRRHAATALLTQIASLGAYHAYLRLRYAFPMCWGALMILIALILAAADLFCPPKKSE